MTSEATLVSVIVPTHNSAGTLEACLRSIRSQIHEPVELIVVDNNSLDDTRKIASTFADIVEVCGPERSRQRNRGAELATGAYLLFVDSDMRLDPNVIHDCLDTVRYSSAPGVIVPEISSGPGFLAKCRALERSCYTGDDTVEAARFYSRVAFVAAGGFDEKLTAFEDWDLSRRVFEGRRYPRTSSEITHDEGNVSLKAMLSKKRYYAGSFVRYRRKHGSLAIRQANLIARPALIRNWRRLVHHPLLSIGIVSMKTLETAAGAVGLVETWGNALWRGESPPNSARGASSNDL